MPTAGATATSAEEAPVFASVNMTSGNPPAASFEELEPRIIHAADLTLDGGETKHGVASTVVDCTGAAPEIMREGAIAAADIEAAAKGPDA